MEEPVRVAVALSGGTAKCVSHIGVLKAFEDSGFEVVRLAGTSGGAVIGSFYAAGMSVTEAARQAAQTRLSHLGGLGFQRLGFFSSSRLYRLIADRIGDVTFDQLRIPLSVVVTNLLTGEREVIEDGVVALAAQASSCIPQIYAPVEMNGGLYVDGGLVEYLPVRALLPHEPPLIVGVNLGYHREPRRPRHLLSLVMQTMGIVAQQNAAVSAQYADLILRPDLSRFHPFEIREAEAMIEVGYETAMARVPDIRRAWDEKRSLRHRLRSWWHRMRRRDAEDPSEEFLEAG